jgi:hypothetical protein
MLYNLAALTDFPSLLTTSLIDDPLPSPPSMPPSIS